MSGSAVRLEVGVPGDVAERLELAATLGGRSVGAQALLVLCEWAQGDAAAGAHGGGIVHVYYAWRAARAAAEAARSRGDRGSEDGWVAWEWAAARIRERAIGAARAAAERFGGWPEDIPGCEGYVRLDLGCVECAKRTPHRIMGADGDVSCECAVCGARGLGETLERADRDAARAAWMEAFG